jgi:RHS repeat-associated protein
MQMQLSSGTPIPDGILAAIALRNEKPRLGVPSRNPALHQGIDAANSTIVLGLQSTAALNRIGSRYTGKERDAESGLDYFGARYYGSNMGRFMSPDPSGLLTQRPADPQSWNMYAYARNNPLIFIDPTGLDCVYANDAGNGVESIDHSSNSGECGQNGGSWAPGYVNENWVKFNDSTQQFQAVSLNGTVDYTTFAAGATTQFNANESACTSGCSGFSTANAGWLQGQLEANGVDLGGYLPFLANRTEPLGGGLGMRLLSGPLNPNDDNWAGPGGFGPPSGRGDWAASVHDYSFSQYGENGIHLSMYFNPTLSPATSNALIQANSTLIRNAGGIQGVKMGMFFGVVNAFQWYANSFK